MTTMQRFVLMMAVLLGLCMAPGCSSPDVIVPGGPGGHQYTRAEVDRRIADGAVFTPADTCLDCCQPYTCFSWCDCGGDGGEGHPGPPWTPPGCDWYCVYGRCGWHCDDGDDGYD